MRRPQLSGVVEDLDSANAAWTDAMARLEAATALVKQGKASAIPDAQAAIFDGMKAAGTIATITNGEPDAALQARWVAALQGFESATSTLAPTASGVGSIITKDGLRVGNTVFSWWLVAAAAAAWWYLPRVLRMRGRAD